MKNIQNICREQSIWPVDNIGVQIKNPTPFTFTDIIVIIIIIILDGSLIGLTYESKIEKDVRVIQTCQTPIRLDSLTGVH